MELDELKSLNIENLCTRQELWALNFSSSIDILEKARDMIVDIMESINFNDLSTQEKGYVENWKRSLESHLTQIRDFNLTVGDNPTNTRDNIESNIRSFYNEFVERVRWIHTYIINQSLIDATKSKDFLKSIKEIQWLKHEFLEEKKWLQDIVKQLQQEREKVQASKGQISASYLSQEFEAQYENYKNEANDRYTYAKIMYFLLLFVIVVNLVVYFRMIYKGQDITNLFNYEYGIGLIALVSILFYGLTFCSNNYKVAKNLESINRHRRNVAETFGRFLETSPDDVETKNKLLQEAAVAMFQYIWSWYLVKDTGISTPTLEMVNKILPVNKTE